MTRGPAVKEAERALLERDAELAEHRRVLVSATTGDGAVLVIRGVAGAGKSRLLAAACTEASNSGFCVLRSRGGELERDFPFGIARQLFEPLLANAAAPARRRLLSGAAALARRALAPQPESFAAPGEQALFAALHGLYWLSANLSERSPLLLAVDDLQWVDRESLQWLAYLAGRIEGLPAVLAVALRTGDVGDANELVDTIASQPGARVQAPKPLSEAAVEQLVRRSLGPPDAEFVTACHAATRGNPFMVEALIAALATDGVAPRADAAKRVGNLGPDTVARATFLRLAQIGSSAEALARAIAILGIDAELRHAAALAGLDQRAAGITVDALVGARILAPGRPLEFVHPIVRAAVYADIPAAQRALAHRDAAGVLAAEGAAAERVAAHLVAAEPARDQAVVATLRAAAHQALQRGATGRAAAWLRRALEEPPAKELRPQLLVELGAAERHAGAAAGADALAEAAAASDDPSLRTAALRELGRTRLVEGRLAEAAAALERAVEEAPAKALEREIEAELICLGQMGMLPGYSTSDRIERVRKEEPHPDDAGSRMLLAVLAFEALRGCEPASMSVGLAEAAVSAGVEAEPVFDSAPRYLAVLSLIFADRFEVAAMRCEQELAAARGRGSVFGFMAISALSAVLSYRRGRLADAETDAQSVLDAPGAENVVFRSFAFAVLGDCRLAQGRLDSARATLAAAGALDLPPEHLLHALLYTRGSYKAATGDRRAGLADILECGRLLVASRSSNPAQVPWRSSGAQIYAALGDAEQARILADEEVALARAFAAPRALGVALRTAGLVAETDASVELLAEAVAVLEGSGAELELANALVEQGAALRRGGHRRDAQLPLRRALDLADRCGAAPLAARARDELRATGARPRRPALSGVASLSPRERRVAQLAAEGLTNREIAEALFVTLKTVETHLGHSYRKLGVTSRHELPAELRRGPEPRA